MCAYFSLVFGRGGVGGLSQRCSTSVSRALGAATAPYVEEPAQLLILFTLWPRIVHGIFNKIIM